MALPRGLDGVVLIAADAAVALGAAIAIVVLAVAVVLVLWVASKRRQLRWREAWEKINRQPEAALRLLQEFAPQPGPTPANARQRSAWQHARYGQAICLARMHRLEEATGALREAGDHAPSLGELVQLCAALLATGRKNASPLAIDAWCQFLAIPPSADFRETRRFLERALLKNLQPQPLDSDGRLRQRLALAGQARQIVPHVAAIERARGLILVRLERWTEAVAPLEAALASQPDDRQALGGLAMSLRATGDRRRLLETLLAVQRELPGAAVAYEAAVLTLELDDKSAAGQPTLRALAAAQPLFEAAVEHDPEHADAWLALAKTQWQRGLVQPARRSAERAIALEPRRADGHFLLGEIQLACEEAIEARRTLTRALQLEPGSQRGIRLAGDLEFADDNYGAALSHYQRLPKEAADDQELQDRMARCCLETGQPEGAIELLARRQSLTPITRLVLARALARVGRWAESLQRYETEPMPPASAEWSYYHAAALAANGQHAKASDWFQQLLSDETWGQRARRQLGHIRVLEGDYEQAAELYRDADPAVSNFDLGRVALLSGDAQQARERFAAAGQTQPRAAAAIRFAIAYTDAELGRPEGLQALANDRELAADVQEALGDRAFEARRYLEALPAYEQAIAGKREPPMGVLQRLATGYLHLRRDQEAIAHLTALAQRQPDDPALATNLALCRWRLGRAAFAKAAWDDARREFLAAFEVVKDHHRQAADALLAWALEAAFRDVLTVLDDATATPEQIDRAIEACHFGCQQAGRDLRWQLVAGIATARAGEFAASIAHFEEACSLSARKPPAMLGLALSQHEAGEHVGAGQTLADLLALLDEREPGGETEALRVRVRFAQAMVAARAKDWTAAAEALTPLITHPLLQRSKQPSPRDVAEVAVAYHGAAGNHQTARQLAHQHLPHMKGESDVLIGLVQADAKDYAGAAATLGRSLRADSNPKVVKVLVSCLLAIAAEAVLRGNLQAANASIMAALGYEPQSKAAKNLLEALGLEGSLKSLNVAQLNEAIGQCQQQLASGGEASPEVVRTLAALLHRKAMEAEKSGSNPDTTWSVCLSFWKKNILDNREFWPRFVASYNASRSRREQLRDDEAGALRGALADRLVETHLALARHFRQNRSENGLVRHLNLIWQWKPDFKLPDDFLPALVNVRELDDWQAEMLEKASGRLANAKLKDEFRKLLAIYWYNAGGRIVTEISAALQEGRSSTTADKGRRAKALLQRAYALDPTDADIRALHQLTQEKL